MEPIFDRTIAVIADDEKREGRANERGTGNLEARTGRQLSQEEKAEKASHVVVNDGSIDDLEGQLRKLYPQLEGAGGMSAARSGTRSAGTSRGATRRRSRAAEIRRTRFRRAVISLILLLCVGAAIGVWRYDFGEKLQELTLPLRHDDIIRQQAREKDVPADLIAAVIYKESKFEDQTSSVGARGLMQITPATADTIENLSGGQTFVYDDLADPDLNIRYGTFYLHYLIQKYDGNLVAVLSAYNAGEGNADAWGGVAMKESDIKFAETRDYVDEILQKRVEYRKKYAAELGL